MTIQKQWFTFLRSYLDAIRELPKSQQADVYQALAEYALDGIEPTFTGSRLAVFKSFRPVVDNSNKTAARNAKNGAKGGRPKQVVKTQKNPDVTQKNPEESDSNPDITQKKPEYGVWSMEYGLKEKPPNGGKKKSAFSKPSEDEVKAYCSQQGYLVDETQFVAFYESKGWKVGNSSMKDWHAAVRTWHYRNHPKTVKGGQDDDWPENKRYRLPAQN
jgi:ribosomal protein S12